MKRLWWLAAVLGAFVSTAAMAQGSEDEAGDVSEVDKDSAGPLRDRIRPVSGHAFRQAGRFEISPGIGISVRDAFFTKYIFGAAATYHFTESLGVSLRGGYSVPVISGAAQICTQTADPLNNVARGCRLPTMDELTRENGNPANKAYGLIGLLASVDLQYAPIYGKISLVAEQFLSFNMYGLVGPAVVMYGPNNTLTFGGNVGLGFRFFINKWMTVRVELRDTIYQEEGFFRGATAETATGSLRNQLMGEFGFSMFLPTVFGEE